MGSTPFIIRPSANENMNIWQLLTCQHKPNISIKFYGGSDFTQKRKISLKTFSKTASIGPQDNSIIRFATEEAAIFRCSVRGSLWKSPVEVVYCKNYSTYLDLY